jgi:hypothetical protein
MPWIAPEGLLHGERIRDLSDTAQLYWPYLYAASNGYGRFEIDYEGIVGSAFSSLRKKPTEKELLALLKEYRDKHLLFTYRASDGRMWGAWDSTSGQKYFNAADKKSPAPPDAEFQAWREAYARKRAAAAARRLSFADQLAESESKKQVELEFEPEKPKLFSENANLGTENLEFGKENAISELSFVKSEKSFPNPLNTTQLNTGLNTTQHNSFNTTQCADAKTVEEKARTPAQVEAEFERWAETVYERHPRQRFKKQVAQALRARFAEDPAAREIFDRNHADWCDSPDWIKRPEYVPLLVDREGDGWIADEAWKHPPIRAMPMRREVIDYTGPPATVEEELELAARFRAYGLHTQAEATEELARKKQKGNHAAAQAG